MILNSKNNQFVFFFPANFWSPKIKAQYKDFYKSLLLPYDDIDDYVLSTLQAVDFPGWKIEGARQTRHRGAEQDYKGAAPVKDVFDKSFQLTFKTTEGFMNYALFTNNAIDYLDHNNETQYYDDMVLGMMNNEGYLMQIITFKKVIMTGMSKYSLDYSGMDNSFNKFTVDFKYSDWRIDAMFDKMLNLYTDN